MSPHWVKIASPSGALAVGRIRTRPEPVVRSRSHRSTSSVHGSNSPEPSSAKRLIAFDLSERSSLVGQPEELRLVRLAEEVLAEGAQHPLHLAHVRLDGAQLELEQLR